MYKKILIICLVLLGIFFSIPFAAKYYTESNYPVKIGSVSFGFKGLEFGNVKVSRQDISGTLDNVTVDFNRNIIIDGGNIKYSFVNSEVALKVFKKEITKNKSTKNIIANNIKVKINYKDGTIDTNGLSYINGLVSIEKAIVKNIMVKGFVVSGIVYDVFGNIKTESGNAKFGIINTPYTSIDFDHISFNKKTLNISYADIGQGLFVVYNTTIDINTFSTTSEMAIVNHPKLFSNKITLNNLNTYNFDMVNEFKVSVNGAWFIIDPISQRIRANEHCQNWINTLPKELLTKEIEQIKFNGSFGFDVSLDPVVVKINESCTLKNKPAFLNLHNTFTYTAYHPNKEPFKRTTGPGSADWVGINDVSSNMIMALEVAEDRSFFKHRGIVPKLLEVCLRDRINNGRKCGGSTITMQLVKNLWLNRKQTAGRKVQEIILTKALESLSKEQILELYINVVEFGPDLYGIGPAAVKLLDTYPADLTLDEALYLSLRLPAPNKAGTLEQTKGFRKKILTGLAKTGKISEQELEETYFNGQD